MPGQVTTNPVPRQLWQRRPVNGALLSGWYLGPHRNPRATRPPVDVQSVFCGTASNPNSGLEENSKGDYRIPPTSIRLINREVPVEGLEIFQRNSASGFFHLKHENQEITAIDQVENLFGRLIGWREGEALP